jgi:hypothetical protein
MRNPATIPSWLVSAALHLMLLLAFGLLTTAGTPVGSAEEPGRTVGIVLARRTADKREYFSPDNAPAEQITDATPADITPLGQGRPKSAAESPAPVDAAEFLPKTPLIGPGDLAGGGPTGAQGATTGKAASNAVGGGAKTSVFGLEGEGHKFVYVFDRSASMSEPRGLPLAAAKYELISSLRSLGATHQFLIIFFNHEEPRVFNPTGQPGRLVFADDANREAARRFVERVTADGGTRPEAALVAAVKTRPDVIFFLTDGQDLDYAMIERITRLNRGGASIHCIEFAAGPGGQNQLLIRLASMNGGKHVRVNTQRLGEPQQR